jgi:hypothetical protein
MRLKLVLCLALLASPAFAAAENWQPVTGEADTYLDADFLKVDQQTGLVVLRYAVGKPGGAGYAEWPSKEPISVYAVDCKADTFKDLGLDFDGDAPLPDNWRKRANNSGAKFGVGGAAALACKQSGVLPKVALP